VKRRTEPTSLAEAKQVLGLSVPAAARLAGVSEAKMYQAVATGEVQSVRAFGRVLVCAVPFLALFGANSDAENVVADATSGLGSESAHERKSCGKRPK
jgi:hypothetical protein